MKVLNPYSLSSLLLVSMFSAATMAASQLIPIKATVTGTCQFNTSATTVSFTLDPTSTADATGTVVNPPQFWCTKGTVYTISDSGAPYEMKHDTLAESIPYTFSYVDDGSGTGTGKSGAINITINSTVANSAFVDASVGNYNDIVTLTINP